MSGSSGAISMARSLFFVGPLALALLAALFVYSDSARAEGRCPPGQYPIGDQGVGGCAPIPGGAGGAGGAPVATGRWIKTWGAIALSPSGASGASTGKRSKSSAVAEAEAVCARGGADGCKVAIAYKNQCAVAVVPKSLVGGTFFSSSATIEESKARAMKQCESKGLVDCQAIFEDCTKPEFQDF